MINAFALDDRRLRQVPVNGPQDLATAGLWIDLVDPSEAEIEWMNSAFHQEMPDAEEIEEIEASARYYEDESGLHIRSYSLHKADDRIVTINVAFTLNDTRLFTLHQEDLLSFRLFRLRARRQAGLAKDPLSIMLGLFEADVERLADILEEIYEALEGVSQNVLSDEPHVMEDVVAELAEQEDINGKARLSLMDKQRVLSFLLRSGVPNAEQTQRLREILRDIESLIAHNSFLFEKVNFLLDAATSIIGLEQNRTIKIFSVAATAFLPPTLVASIYGMNFQFMPELGQTWGYPLALLLMLVSGIAPYWYFKRKGWL